MRPVTQIDRLCEIVRRKVIRQYLPPADDATDALGGRFFNPVAKHDHIKHLWNGPIGGRRVGATWLRREEHLMVASVAATRAPA